MRTDLGEWKGGTGGGGREADWARGRKVGEGKKEGDKGGAVA